MQCETIKISADNEQGFIIINLSDFDDSKHKKFKEKKAQNKTKAD